MLWKGSPPIRRESTVEPKGCVLTVVLSISISLSPVRFSPRYQSAIFLCHHSQDIIIASKFGITFSIVCCPHEKSRLFYSIFFGFCPSDFVIWVCHLCWSFEIGVFVSWSLSALISLDNISQSVSELHRRHVLNLRNIPFLFGWKLELFWSSLLFPADRRHHHHHHVVNWYVKDNWRESMSVHSFHLFARARPFCFIFVSDKGRGKKK